MTAQQITEAGTGLSVAQTPSKRRLKVPSAQQQRQPVASEERQPKPAQRQPEPKTGVALGTGQQEPEERQQGQSSKPTTGKLSQERCFAQAKPSEIASESGGGSTARLSAAGGRGSTVIVKAF